MLGTCFDFGCDYYNELVSGQILKSIPQEDTNMQVLS